MKDHLQALVRKCDPLQGRNVAREYLQARILEAMQRAGAMASLAFQGGTCLRFLFALPRYSEDLDFALEGEPSKYELRRYLQAIRGALSAESYRVELRVRDRHIVHRALVGFPGLELGLSPHASEALAIRIEVDTNPPAGAETAIALVRRHTTLRLHHHGQSSLLAGKLHAVLQRLQRTGSLRSHLVSQRPRLAAAQLVAVDSRAHAERLGRRGDDGTTRASRPSVRIGPDSVASKSSSTRKITRAFSSASASEGA